jgi:transcriptional antiterminator
VKTIKQIADEIGVSKQAVRNQIAKLGLQNSLRKNGNQFAIDEQQEAMIIQAFTNKSQSENANGLQSELVIALQSSLRFMEQENEFLRRQLETKDEQLERLDRRLAEAQILHADTKKLLPAMQETGGDPAEPATPSKKFFARIFGRKSY